MIRVTRLDGTELYLNAEFIQSVESTPDTHVVLMNGHSYIVKEPDVEIVDRVMEYRHTAYGGGSGVKPPLKLLNDEKTG
ncbi:MAG: flagellar FlbD family protein [Dehalococcoidia bacterium]|mgnify:CR=1|nr:flagellar FlbD family protein [Dehalococcoidia bacterium]